MSGMNAMSGTGHLKDREAGGRQGWRFCRAFVAEQPQEPAATLFSVGTRPSQAKGENVFESLKYNKKWLFFSGHAALPQGVSLGFAVLVPFFPLAETAF